jgi:hypothetical protein
LNSLESAIRPDSKDGVREAAQREITNLGKLVDPVKKGSTVPSYLPLL